MNGHLKSCFFSAFAIHAELVSDFGDLLCVIFMQPINDKFPDSGALGHGSKWGLKMSNFVDLHFASTS